MNDDERKIFDKILEKAEADEKVWNDYNSQDELSWRISDEHEDEIMERMFLVYFVKKYLDLIDKN